MPTESGSWEILAGEATAATASITVVSAASAGDPTALRTLTHPDGTNFPLVTYNQNPDRTINFDQIPLSPPESKLLRTLDTTQAFVTQNSLDDVLVTEVWNGSDRRSRMLASQFRRMYELAVNPPVIASPEQFVVWAPNDRTTNTFNVIITGIRVGGSGTRMDFKEIGLFAAGDLDAVATGLVDRTVEIDLKIVSQV